MTESKLPLEKLFPGRWLWDHGGMVPDLNIFDTVVWLYINHRQGNNPSWNVSINKISVDLKLSRTTIKTSIKRLIRFDLLMTVSGKEKGRPNQYIILAPEGSDQLFKTNKGGREATRGGPQVTRGGRETTRGGRPRVSVEALELDPDTDSIRKRFGQDEDQDHQNHQIFEEIVAGIEEDQPWWEIDAEQEG